MPTTNTETNTASAPIRTSSCWPPQLLDASNSDSIAPRSSSVYTSEAGPTTSRTRSPMLVVSASAAVTTPMRDTPAALFSARGSGTRTSSPSVTPETVMGRSAPAVNTSTVSPTERP
ncbi:MAG TPA: hypothetical protein K8V84_01635 [Nocardiopsis listeri]|uniref:hypothetical protein n=1 Tax=Nocardiopsis listeri TaxID=53440 RepID=UPI001DE10D37|nr:hypothetical protein [Nocardiopsis listeri]HJE57207.1 hypothetical protein [Nocardiopsis listeri]